MHIVVMGAGGVGGYFGAKLDRKSTRLNSSHGYISYAVFCLKKKQHNRDLWYGTAPTPQTDSPPVAICRAASTHVFSRPAPWHPSSIPVPPPCRPRDRAGCP